jgi:hypothetical protein
MTSLADLPWDEVRVGMKVTSYRGIPGEVTKVEDDSRGSFRDPDRCYVTIAWENGNISMQPHYNLDAVTLR